MHFLLTSLLAGLLLLSGCSSDKTEPAANDQAAVEPAAVAESAAESQRLAAGSKTLEVAGDKFAQPIKVSYSTSFNFKGLKTFQLVNLAPGSSGLIGMVLAEAETELRNQLIESGLSLSVNPDVTVYYIASHEDNLVVSDGQERMGYKNYRCEHCDENKIPVLKEKGTIYIQVIDNSSSRVIWRGYGVSNLENVDIQEELALVRSYVAEMFTASPWGDIKPFQPTLPIEIDYLDDFDFNTVKTFKLIRYQGPELDYDTHDMVIAKAETELTNQLIERGMLPSETPDMEFYYLLARDDKLNVVTGNNARYQSFHCVHCDVNKLPADYKGGTIIIQMVDPKRQRLVWRGVGTANLDNISTVDEAELARQYVQEMFMAEPWGSVQSSNTAN
jgi:hypothetical protein